MPFASIGERVNGPYGEWVRTFWAHGWLDRFKIVLIGSLDNVRDSAWADPAQESQRMIGHSFPSDPAVLSELVAMELMLEGEDIEWHLDSVRRFDLPSPGEAARFAVAQTARAMQGRVVDGDSVRSWQRQPPITRARVIASVVDVCESTQALLARPVLVADRT
ncbi:hypothetical protein [Microbacterium sp. GXS0129]|uniref:hypothetical protein n=1 Tax=Microbacterium sp. GXS0129 TaxID=3377836 RepID=UPI00383B0983